VNYTYLIKLRAASFINDASGFIEPGVIIISNPRPHKRIFRSLRIPDHVKRRVIARITKGGGPRELLGITPKKSPGSEREIQDEYRRRVRNWPKRVEVQEQKQPVEITDCRRNISVKLAVHIEKVNIIQGCAEQLGPSFCLLIVYGRCWRTSS